MSVVNHASFHAHIKLCKENPSVEFWAYTKSLNYWVNRINDIPKNLVLTASRGGKQDSQARLGQATLHTLELEGPRRAERRTEDDPTA